MEWPCVIVLAVASLWCEVSGVRLRRSSVASGSYAGINADGTQYGGTFDPTSHQNLQQDLNPGLDRSLYAPGYPFADPIAAAAGQNGFESDYFRTLSLFLQQNRVKRGAMASASAFASSGSDRDTRRTPGFATAQASASGIGGIGGSNRVFMNNINNQRAALDASQRAFALASQGNGGFQGPASFGYGYNTGYYPGHNPGYNIGYNPGFNAASPQGGYQGGGGNPQAVSPQGGYQGGGGNPQAASPQGGYQGGAGNPQAAFAGASIDPTGTRQIASISPSNPGSPNVDVHGAAPSGGGGDGKFYGVSSSSFSSSSNVNGVPTSRRTAHTVVNDNGKITEHKVVS